MKNASDSVKASCDIKNRSRIKDLWNKQINKLKHGSFTCPICREECNGLSALGAHLKEHCT